MPSLGDMPDGYHEYSVKVMTLTNTFVTRVFSESTQQELFDQTRKNIQEEGGFLTNHAGETCYVPKEQITFLGISYLGSK